ncbi:MAG: substrate-binding domain-containing protein [Leucobacter sp.]
MSRSPSVMRAAAIVRLLASLPEPQTVREIAEQTGLPPTSLRGICHALTKERMLIKGDDGRYWLGPRIAEFAAAALLAQEYALRIGLLIPTEENSYYTAVLAAAMAEVHEAGGELIVRQADEDADRQRAQWQELLDIGVDVILIDSVDSSALEDLVESTRAVGLPIVAVGSRVSRVHASIVSNNTQAGLLSGRFLASQLPERAKVAVIEGLRKNANAERVTGFTEAMQEYPGIEVVAHATGSMDNPASGRAAMKAVLKDHPDLDGVFAVCDPVAFGAADVVQRSGRNIQLVSVDGRAKAVKQITADGPIIATAAQDPARIIRTGLEVARGLTAGARPIQGTVQIPVRLITKANAGAYTPWL